jgi:hypothetical protein
MSDRDGGWKGIRIDRRTLRQIGKFIGMVLAFIYWCICMLVSLALIWPE